MLALSYPEPSATVWSSCRPSFTSKEVFTDPQMKFDVSYIYSTCEIVQGPYYVLFRATFRTGLRTKSTVLASTQKLRSYYDYGHYGTGTFIWLLLYVLYRHRFTKDETQSLATVQRQLYEDEM